MGSDERQVVLRWVLTRWIVPALRIVVALRLCNSARWSLKGGFILPETRYVTGESC